MERAGPSARVLQIGAGFHRIIILEALANRGVSLTVVEMGDRMVPRMMGQGAGGMIKRWVQSKGIQSTRQRVWRLSRRCVRRAGVRLSSGERVAADLVISATGVKPNIEISGRRGHRMRSRRVDRRAAADQCRCEFYAAGDCAEAFD